MIRSGTAALRTAAADGETMGERLRVTSYGGQVTGHRSLADQLGTSARAQNGLRPPDVPTLPHWRTAPTDSPTTGGPP